MNKILQSLVQEVVRIEVSGKEMMNGKLIDVGSDMIVLFDGVDFLYIPLDHIRNFEMDRDNENDVQAPTELPSIVAEESKEDLSFEEVLAQAKGRLVEIYVTGNQSLAWDNYRHYEKLSCIPISRLQNDVYFIGPYQMAYSLCSKS